ncbi:MAG: glycosyltransferase family 2 protein [Lachnospiraceae bacterium]|nr:glycosyltransferase family 2 protein [Lachnospiraceae bacterium]
MQEWNPKIDVIIPIYKPDKKYDRLLQALKKQSLMPNHIYIIHTMAEGKEEKKENSRYAGMNNLSIINIRKEEFNHGGTRNKGVSMSDAEFVLMMTQDAVPADTHLLEELVRPFAEEQVAATYARQLATKEVGVIEQYTRTFNYPEQEQKKKKEDLKRLGIKTYFCSDVCAMYRKSVYEKMGGFVTKTIFNEDMIMASKMIQAGYAIVYAAKAKVYHAHKYTGLQQFQRNFDLGVSHREFSEIFDQVKSESEGIKMVKQTARYLWKQKQPFHVPERSQVFSEF